MKTVKYYFIGNGQNRSPLFANESMALQWWLRQPNKLQQELAKDGKLIFFCQKTHNNEVVDIDEAYRYNLATNKWHYEEDTYITADKMAEMIRSGEMKIEFF